MNKKHSFEDLNVLDRLPTSQYVFMLLWTGDIEL